MLHFDYPYYGELNDGLNDEIQGAIWERKGNAQLVGTEAPVDQKITGTPKFGYRCLSTSSNTDYIEGTIPSLTLSSLQNCEVFCFIRPTASQSGNIFALYNGSLSELSISLTNDCKILVSDASSSVNFTTTHALLLNTWSSLCVRLSRGGIQVLINGETSGGTSETTQGVNWEMSSGTLTARIGGISGQIDEFMMRDSFSTTLPTQPVQATLKVANLAGGGSGALGNVTLNANCIMNTTAKIAELGRTLNISNVQTGYFGAFSPYSEVMILNNETGAYIFRTITAISGSIVTLNAYPSISGKDCQLISVPNFKSLTVNAGVTVKASPFQNNNGGIIVFRCTGDCTINGSLITSGLGRTRTDNLQMTHAKLIDNFLLTRGGNIMILCDGKLTAPSSARIGASWDGSGKNGEPVSGKKGGDGGSGYGGAGGSDVDSNSYGGLGGVGGGGGGTDGGPTLHTGAGYDAGTNGETGGAGATYPRGYSASRAGGTQGKTTGGNGISGGGGGAGGEGTGSTGLSASSGSNVILIAKTLNVSESALSTGGAGGAPENNGYQCGGGGTGFCYIACETTA